MKAAQGKAFAAVLDACVLAPMPLCDTLLRCAESRALFRVLWSRETLGEVRSTLEKFGYSQNQAARRIRAMERAFPEAAVRVTRSAWQAIPDLPDPRDKHVVAAAVQASAPVIVTFNLKHFPSEALAQTGIRVFSPDEFLVSLQRREPGRISEVLDRQARAIGETRNAILERLAPGLPEFVRLVAGK